MNKEFIPHQEALELKELGFDEPCFGYYEDNNLTITFPSTSSNGWKWVGNSIIPAKNTKAPTFSQAFRWFREKYNLHSEIRTYTAKFFTPVIQKLESIVTYIEYGGINSKFNSYEEAELECLKKIIEIVKNKGGDK